MARARTAPQHGHQQNGRNIYEDMLAEAGVQHQQQRRGSEEPPLKRRRAEASHSNEDALDNAETAAPPVPQMQVMERDSEDEDEDMEFEDVDFNAWLRGEEPKSETQDLELNLSAEKAATTPSKKNAERRKPITKEEKERRVHVHQTHILCLLSHVHRRNHWCNDAKVQEALRPRLTDKQIALLNPSGHLSQFGRAESLKDGLAQADKLWKAKFDTVERGLKRALWAEDVEHLQEYEQPDDLDSCIDRDDFRDAARTLQGSRDVGAQLYCALLRSVGVRARLVCSLQPLAPGNTAPTLPKPKQKTPSKLSKEEQVRASMANHERMTKAAREEVKAEAGSSTTRRRLGHPGATLYNFEPSRPPKDSQPKFKTPKRIRESSYPVYWVEVLDVGHQKWQPADPVVTHTFWKPKSLEPPITDKENCLTYVVAFDADGTAKDVTRRYAKAYTAKTRRLRIETAAEDGEGWWRRAMKPFRRKRLEDLDQIEENELVGVEAREPMPRNVQDFKNHPVYALERHLRRHEVLVPDATPSGTVGAGSKGPLEKIYRRKDVRIARTTEKWYRMGREVKPNEIPAKWLPKKAKPRNGRFHDDEDDDDEGLAGTPLYRQDQTDLYIPPPVRNGRIPKNKFGNIDAYVPSMIPRGAIHMEHEQATRAAFLLGVDYAPALTGFSFDGRQGVAVLRGIVVAREYEEAILAVIEGLGDLEQEMEEERRRMRALKTWRRLLMSLRIRERVWQGVDAEERREAERDADMELEMEEAPSDVTEEFEIEEDDDDYGGGGFMVDDDDGGGGGFIP